MGRDLHLWFYAFCISVQVARRGLKHSSNFQSLGVNGRPDISFGWKLVHAEQKNNAVRCNSILPWMDDSLGNPLHWKWTMATPLPISSTPFDIRFWNLEVQIRRMFSLCRMKTTTATPPITTSQSVIYYGVRVLNRIYGVDIGNDPAWSWGQ